MQLFLHKVSAAILVFSIMTACLCNLASAQKSPGNPPDIQWEANFKFGFPVWIARFSKPENLSPYTQKVFLHIDPNNFTEDNLKQVFLGLAALYDQTKDLSITAFSNRDSLESQIWEGMFVSIIKNIHNLKDEAQEERVRNRRDYRAFYWRFADKEYFRYTPNLNNQEMVTVTLRSKSIRYTGDSKADIILAIRNGDILKVLSLLNEGTYVNTRSKEEDTALMTAALKREKEIVTELLSRGADVNASNSEGWTALMYAVTNKDTDTARALLERGAEVNARNKYGDSALTLAASKRCEDIAKMLLTKGAGIDVQDEDGDTALIDAVNNSDLALVELFLTAGANTEIRNNDGETALMIAEEKKMITERFRVLAEQENLPYERDKFMALQPTYEKMIKLLKRE